MTKSKLSFRPLAIIRGVLVTLCIILLSSCATPTPTPQPTPKKELELSESSIELSAVFSAELAAARNNFNLATEKYLEAAHASGNEDYYELAAYAISHAMDQSPTEVERTLAKRVNDQWIENFPRSEKRNRFTVRFLVNKGRTGQAIALALRAPEPAHREALLAYCLHGLSPNLWQHNNGPLIEALDQLSAQVQSALAAKTIQAYLLWPNDQATSNQTFKELLLAPESNELTERIYLNLLTDDKQYTEAKALILKRHSPPYNFAIALQLAKLDALELQQFDPLKLIEEDYPEAVNHQWLVSQLHWSLTHNLVELAEYYLAKAQLNPEFANNSQLYRARLAYLQNRKEEAIEIYLKIDKVADLPYASRGLNELLLSTQHIDPRFGQWYSTLRSKHPSAASAWLAIEVQAIMQYCNAATAIPYLQHLSEQVPPDQRAIMLIHQYFEQQGNPVAAQNLLVDLLKRHPNEAWAINELAYRWLEEDIHLESALKLLAKAVELAPNDANILDSYGWALYKLGQPSEALKFIKKAAQLSDHPEIQKHLNIIMHALPAQPTSNIQ